MAENKYERIEGNSDNKLSIFLHRASQINSLDFPLYFLQSLSMPSPAHERTMIEKEEKVFGPRLAYGSSSTREEDKRNK